MVASSHATGVNESDFLWNACTSGSYQQVCTKLQHDGIDIEERGGTHNTTLLITAAEHGESDIVAMLLNAKADTSAQDALGMSALHHAVSGGFLKITEMLLENGADANCRVGM